MILQPVQVTQKYFGFDDSNNFRLMLRLSRLVDNFVYVVFLEGNEINSDVLSIMLQDIFKTRSFESIVGQQCHLRMLEDGSFELGNERNDVWISVNVPD